MKNSNVDIYMICDSTSHHIICTEIREGLHNVLMYKSRMCTSIETRVIYSQRLGISSYLFIGEEGSL
jgi:hypothetical protein